jgi:hypothetical protein
MEIHMKTSIRLALMLATASALTLTVAACDSPKEKAADESAQVLENDAIAIRDSADNAADSMEARAIELDTKMDGKDLAAEHAMAQEAKAVRDKADTEADAIEDRADGVRKAAAGN